MVIFWLSGLQKHFWCFLYTLTQVLGFGLNTVFFQFPLLSLSVEFSCKQELSPGTFIYTSVSSSSRLLFFLFFCKTQEARCGTEILTKPSQIQTTWSLAQTCPHICPDIYPPLSSVHRSETRGLTMEKQMMVDRVNHSRP